MLGLAPCRDIARGRAHDDTAVFAAAVTPAPAQQPGPPRWHDFVRRVAQPGPKGNCLACWGTQKDQHQRLLEASC